MMKWWWIWYCWDEFDIAQDIKESDNEVNDGSDDEFDIVEDIKESDNKVNDGSDDDDLASRL